MYNQGLMPQPPRAENKVRHWTPFTCLKEVILYMKTLLIVMNLILDVFLLDFYEVQNRGRRKYYEISSSILRQGGLQLSELWCEIYPDLWAIFYTQC